MSVEFTPNPVVPQPDTGGDGSRIPPDITAVGQDGEGGEQSHVELIDPFDETQRLLRMLGGQPLGPSILDTPPQEDDNQTAARILKGLVDFSDS